MIDVVGVTHHYGVRPVLRDINVHIPAGQLVALMGPNGMGKSTLLGIVAGVIAPYKGHVLIGGRRRRSSVEDELAIRKQCFYLPDHPWLPNGRTGREFVLAVGRLYDIEYERLMEHTDRLLEVFQLDEQADSPIGSYSTGQKKKIALCAALVCQTPVMLLDEPFGGGLDPAGLLALKRVLQRLAERDDVTIIVATPVPELVEEFAEGVMIIRDGRIAAYDTIDGLRQKTGTSGSLQDVLGQLIDPKASTDLERYLREWS